MNTRIIAQLVEKDWQLNKGPLTLYVLLGFASLWVFAIPGEIAVNIGAVLLITIIAVIGIHMVMTTILYERKDQTLPFVMSLPVSYREYTVAKVLSIGIVSGGAWLLISGTIMALTLLLDGIPNGVIPYVTMVMLYMLVIYAVLMAVALVSEHEPTIIVVMTLLNVTISIFMIGVGNLDTVGPFIRGEVAVWNTSALAIVAAEIGVIGLAICLTFFFQSRKRSFL